MYLRKIHQETNIDVLKNFIKAVKLGLFTTAIDHPSLPFIQASHIPFIHEDKDDNDKGILKGHLARANPQAKSLIDASRTGALDREVLVMFTSPDNSYVTPQFYTQTKPDTGKVVPTWNYAAVQVYGFIKVYHELNDVTSDFLQSQISHLSDNSEINFDKHWKVTDAPDSYIQNLKKAIIGVEITITRLEGKFKMSQEMPEGDRQGVVEGFENLGDECSKDVAKLVKERCTQ